MLAALLGEKVDVPYASSYRQISLSMLMLKATMQQSETAGSKPL